MDSPNKSPIIWLGEGGVHPKKDNSDVAQKSFKLKMLECLKSTFVQNQPCT